MEQREAKLARRIGAAVRQQRQLHGLSQEALAESVELSTHFIGLVERGQQLPSLTTLLALSRVLGVTLDSLLGSAESAAVPPTWEREAVAALRSVPRPFRPGVLSMLRALSRAPRPLRRFSSAERPPAERAAAESRGRRAKRG
jgi:transcriptional regulator with XRE-family HTH domain